MGFFKFRKSISPVVLTQTKEEWNPDVSLMCDINNKQEFAAIQAIISKYTRSIVAYHESFIMGRVFVEIQFSNSDKALACRNEYDDLFTPTGRIKKKYLKVK